jgi:hypothetical protein
MLPNGKPLGLFRSLSIDFYILSYILSFLFTSNLGDEMKPKKVAGWLIAFILLFDTPTYWCLLSQLFYLIILIIIVGFYFRIWFAILRICTFIHPNGF